MIAAIISPKGIAAIGAAGVRKIGGNEELTTDDLVHIGSCTKAMTSMMIATLVEDGILSWETTLTEALPKLKKSIHPDYHDVTVWELLTHRAGIPANAKNWWAHRTMPIGKRRLAILKESLEDAPAFKRGEHHYSNLGYMIVGCMAEELTHSTWEKLMEKRVFRPLGMSSAGFGPPGTRNKVDQPWGHGRSGEQWQPRQFDNAEALGPAGRIHCTVNDWGKSLALQFSSESSKRKPSKKTKVGSRSRSRKSSKSTVLSLDQKTMDKLITPIGDYAAGWVVVKRPWAKGTVLTHNGFNTMWYAVVWVAPEMDRAFIAVTNSWDKRSGLICDQMIGKLIVIDREK